MIERKSWKEFRDSGLLWWINMILHTFGWAITIDINDDEEITCAYPAKVKYRGFKECINDDGYVKVSQYMKDNAAKLLDEAEL